MTKEQKILSLLAQFKELGIDRQIDYDKFYLYSLITHSTAIEGSTVTEIENQLLFDEGISTKGRSMTELLIWNYQVSIADEGIEMKNVRVSVPLNVRVNLSSRENQIVGLIMENDRITIIELASALSVNERTIRRDIATLKERGVLNRIGADKNGVWKIKR